MHALICIHKCDTKTKKRSPFYNLCASLRMSNKGKEELIPYTSPKLTIPTSFEVLLLSRLWRHQTRDHHKNILSDLSTGNPYWYLLLVFLGLKSSLVSMPGKRFKLRGRSYHEASHALTCMKIYRQLKEIVFPFLWQWIYSLTSRKR